MPLTSYEKGSLYRFLGLYLGSVFVLLATIGYLFYHNNADMMITAIKYEMFYQERILETQLKSLTPEETNASHVLSQLQPERFKVAYFDENGQPLYNTIGTVPDLTTKFYSSAHRCYSTLTLPSSDSGVGTIVLMETELKTRLRELRWKIILYLIGLFLFMGIVGYFLTHLFLRPIHDKIATLDRFIEDTTHELNTPISAILMTLQGLEGIDPKKHDRLRISAQRLSTMYDTLSYSLTQQDTAPPVQPLDLHALLTERIETMRLLAQSKQITFKTDLYPCTVMLPPEAARRLIDNLLSNAIKYNKPAGSITVTLRDYRLEICDTGIGINPAIRDDIFRRYQRANKEEGGFGIGLSIVTHLCRQFDIGLTLESTPGVGSCFALDFSSTTAQAPLILSF